MVKKIVLRVSYDGTNYCGFQKQPNGLSVQDAINAAIFKVSSQQVISTATSRTDSKVHAMDNIVAFDVETTIPHDRFKFALNSRLPEDIRVQSSHLAVDDFHPLRDKFIKTYQYRILNTENADPLRRNYSWHLRYKLDIEEMKRTARLFRGEHDFIAFKCGRRIYKTTIRNIFQSRLVQEGDELVYTIQGNGFMYNMVRILIGTIVAVGLGELTYEDVEKMLHTGTYKKRGDTAPPQGLVLLMTELVDKTKIV